MKLPIHVSESVKRRNPTLFGHLGLGAVETNIAQPAASSTLDSQRQKQQKRPKSLGPSCRITLIAALRNEMDSDNLIGSMKPLRDAVAAWLGVDDADKRVEWGYGQVQVKGTPGAIVRIEAIPA